jgi:hypothetical protein
LSAAIPVTRTQKAGRTLYRLVSYSWSVTVIASIPVTLVGALTLFPPKVSIESAGEYDQADPLSASFIVKNDWFLALSGVTPFLGLCEFLARAPADLKGDCVNRGAVRISAPRWTPRRLEVGESFTVALGDVFKGSVPKFAGGDITIGITFKISPWPMTRIARFVAQEQRNGKYRWLPEALDTK